MTPQGTATGSSADDGPIQAAGGVVVRAGADGPEVVVVHRHRREDWSLPKGHLDPGETAAAAAVREVAEETGVTATIVGELGVTAYEGPRGPKRVTWFLMRPDAGDPAARPPDDEVDVARWIPVAALESLLTYPSDMELVRTALDAGPPR